MRPDIIRRTLQGAVLVALALAVSACLLMPGKFTSDLAIRKDGTFTFSYVGEMHVLALSKMTADKPEPFKPSTCYAEDSGEERPCTKEETKQQKRDWDESQKSQAESRKRDAESMKAFMGGIDPSDPRAAEELTQRLRRQAGWRKVLYKGNGLFEVDFAINGKLDHDFVFPTIERFPMANSFVLIAVRQDGTVRVDASGFGPASSGDSMRGMMQMGAMSGLGNDTAKQDGMPVVDGKFTIRTDGAILANNTDLGPQPDAAGQKLEWLVNLRTPAAPTALIKLR
jgi:hypothetical protein